MTRRVLRTHVFKIIYSCEFYNAKEFASQVDTYLDEQEIASPDNVEIKEKACKVFDHIAEIDNEINSAAKGWKTSRMSKVDLAILRVALYEMRFDSDVPTSVAINEAVELAKSYSGSDAASFINGVLGKLSQDGKA